MDKYLKGNKSEIPILYHIQQIPNGSMTKMKRNIKYKCRLHVYFINGKKPKTKQGTKDRSN